MQCVVKVVAVFQWIFRIYGATMIGDGCVGARVGWGGRRIESGPFWSFFFFLLYFYFKERCGKRDAILLFFLPLSLPYPLCLVTIAQRGLSHQYPLLLGTSPVLFCSAEAVWLRVLAFFFFLDYPGTWSRWVSFYILDIRGTRP